MRALAAALLLALCAAAAGCGGSGDDAPRRVEGSVDLERPERAVTGAAALSFTGRVRPADSVVAVSDGDVRVEPSGRFTVAVASPRRGVKTVRIEATKPGHRPWRIDVGVVRGPAREVRVPERDVSAPTAALVVDPGARQRPSVFTSPSRAGDEPLTVVLPRPSFRATAVARDAEGGTGRIRLSVETVTRCGASERRRVRYRPPPQIQSIALPPGASAPVERQRAARIRLPVGRGCRVRGEVWAEATDAHGLQAVTRHAGFRHP